MSDLLGAASRIDDAARTLDRMFLQPGTGLGSSASASITQVMSDTTTQLAAAMPNGLGSELRSFYIPYDANVTTLANVRSQLAHLGAVTRAVHELGGVDHVVSQGGLDAIDGAADVIRRSLLLDGVNQLRSAGALVDERPFGISMSSKARSQHVAQVRRALEAPITELTQAGFLDDSGAALIERMRNASYDVSRATYDSVMQDAKAVVHDMTIANPATLPGPSAEWSERMLVSTRARAIAEETSSRARLPVAPRLATLADDESVLAHAHAALDQHAATFEALQTAAGSETVHSAPFRGLLASARDKIGRAAEDLDRIKLLLADAPDDLRDASDLASHWASYNARAVNNGTNGSVDSRMLANTLTNIRRLQTGLDDVLQEPDLLRAGTDVADEVREVLARPGARLDLDVLRELFDGPSSTAARAALVEHVADVTPHAPGQPRTTDIAESLRLLDEVELIGRSIRDQTEKGRWVPTERSLAEQPFTRAALEVVERADTALGTRPLVSEATSNRLWSSVLSLRDKLNGTSTAAPHSWDFETLLDGAGTYRRELAAHAERAAADGGLRAISPSSRPTQAVEARSRWLVRELDALTAPATDATSAVRIDDAARRATILHDVLRLSNETKDASAREALLQRAATEYQSLGETWRMPDDVAMSLHRMREEIRTTGTIDTGRQLDTSRPGYNTNPGLDRARSIASGLQAWSMFTDGPLPETAVDRLAVAARRGASVRSYFDEMAAAGGDKVDGLPFPSQVEELRLRVAAVEDVAGEAVPASVRAGLDEMYARISGEVTRRNEAYGKFEKPGGIPPEVWAGREQLEAWITALDDAHRTARAAASESISW